MRKLEGAFMSVGIVLASVAMTACGASEGRGEAAESTRGGAAAGDEGAPLEDRGGAGESSARACCEWFGYGAGMEECCQRYEWTSAAECQVPEGHTGGGARVVEAERCDAAQSASSPAVEECVARNCVCAPDAIDCQVDTPECRARCQERYGDGE